MSKELIVLSDSSHSDSPDENPSYLLEDDETEMKSSNPLDQEELEFEAQSSKDAAWYDVASFLSHRFLDTGELEVRVRFVGFGADEDEWVNVKKAVRERSIPLEPSECNKVKVGDVVLCFQEKRNQAIYFDAYVLEVRRRLHDIRGCRCQFLVRYDHDQSEETVPLRRICARPSGYS